MALYSICNIEWIWAANGLIYQQYANYMYYFALPVCFEQSEGQHSTPFSGFGKAAYHKPSFLWKKLCTNILNNFKIQSKQLSTLCPQFTLPKLWLKFIYYNKFYIILINKDQYSDKDKYKFLKLVIISHIQETLLPDLVDPKMPP